MQAINNLLVKFLIAIGGLTAFSTAQAQPPAKRIQFVIDSVPITRGETYYLQPKNIAKISAAKARGKDILDSLIITFKDHTSFLKLYHSRFLSPNDIARKYIPGYNAKSQVLFIWNDQLLTDTAGKGVPEQYFKKAEVIKAAKTSYARVLPAAIILKIYVTEL